MLTKEQQLEQMLRNEQAKELSSDQQSRQQQQSRSNVRKPIRNPFSDHSSLESDSDAQTNPLPPFPPKQPKVKSTLEQVQQGIKWNYNDQIETDILSKLQGQGMKDKKIRQLASKLKSLNIQYEKQKTIRKGLETQLNLNMKTNQQIKNRSMENTRSIEKQRKKSQEKEEEKTKAQNKCQNCKESEKKIMQMRLKNQNTQTELNKALRIIKQQIGQNFNIDLVLSEQSGWKGRQQKIQKLKFRVKELEQKLQSNGVNVSHMSGFTQITNGNKTNGQFSTTSQRSSALIAENKRKQFDNLKIQVQALKSQNQLLQNKVKSLTSRKLTLQNDIKELRAEFDKKKQIFAEKSQNDDKFISLLKTENQKLKKNQKVITKVIYKDTPNQDQINKLKNQLEQMKKLQIGKKNGSSAQISEKQIANSDKNRGLKIGQIGGEKKKQLEEEYIKGNKYLKKLNAEDQQQIYRNWKEGITEKIDKNKD